jgi:hypothetical protein
MRKKKLKIKNVYFCNSYETKTAIYLKIPNKMKNRLTELLEDFLCVNILFFRTEFRLCRFVESKKNIDNSNKKHFGEKKLF